MVTGWNSGERIRSSRDRFATILLSFLLMIGAVIPMSQLGTFSVYAARGVSSWQELKKAVDDGATEITLNGSFSYDGTSVVIKNGNITINGTGTIFSKQTNKYEPMFKVESGGALTIDSGVSLSAKMMGDTGQTCPDGKEGRPTYTKDNFTGALDDPNNPKDYEPKGFFIHVESGGAATLKGTVSDFVTSREKDKTPRYVAPIVANGKDAVFNLDGGTIKNNLVGYIVDDAQANKDAQSIKQYVKGAGPNVPRVPQASVQKENKESFDRPRNKDAGIDGGLPGTGITATAGAVIYKGGAKGTISNGTITNNRGDTGGIMVSGEGTTVNMKSGVISKNVGVQFGGGSTAEQGGTIEMTDGKMEKNVAWFGGGAVYATENGVAWLLGLMNGEDGLHPQFDDRLDGKFLMNGGSLNNNTALTRGGAILADSDSVDVKKGALNDNMSRMLGGAVYVMGDHPKYTYTMYLTGLYVHENVAVSGLKQARESAANGPSSMYTKDDLEAFNNSLQRTLLAPTACGDVPDDVWGEVFSTNSDDMNDGWGTHGTGGGVWLCAYGTTYFNAGATSQVVIAKNYATGAVPLNEYDYPRWIKNSSDGKTIREDIAYNTAASVATGTGRTGGNDLHADTGSSGSVIIKNESHYPGWIDENASTSSQVPYELPVSEGRVNIVNNGKAQKMPDANVQVEVSGNISRRGGGLAANGTFMLGMRDDQANVESAVDLKKTWHATAERKPVSIRVSAVQGTNTAVIADVPLDGEANAPISEYDAVEELAPTGSAWNGRFKLPIELNGSEGEIIKVFTLVLKERYREAEDTDGIIDPTTLQGRAKLAAAIKSIKENHKDPSSGEIDEEAAMEEINSAISIKFSDNLKLSCKEYEMVYDDVSEKWTIKTEGGQPVESSSYVFTSKDVDLSEASFDLQSTSFYGEEYNEETDQMEPVEIYQVHVFGIELALSAQNDNNPITEKYVNKEVHSDIVNFDQDFEYDIMAYVPLTAEAFTISDTLVDGLEFAGPGGNANTNPNQVVRSIAVKTLNNHKPGEEGSVSGPGEPGRNGNPMNLKPGQHPVLPGGKTINVDTKLRISGKTLTITVPAGNTLDLLKGKWIQVTFGARIEDKYRSLDALKDLSAGVYGKGKSWEGTATDKKGNPASTYLVANGDKAIVAPILAKVGPDPVIWAVEAPSRLFARTAKGDYYATPMNDKSGSIWAYLDQYLINDNNERYPNPDWTNADNRYHGRVPHASDTKKQLEMNDSKLNSLKGMPLVVGSKVTKAAEGATRYFAEVKDAEGGVHIWATDKGELDSLKWHEVTEKSSDEYVNAQGRLSNDRYTIRMLDLTSDTVTLDPDSETGKNWPVISKEEHEGMANQGSYSVKFGNNAEAKTYKTNTVTVAPETTEIDVAKKWAPDNKWPAGVDSVTLTVYALNKQNDEKTVYVDEDGKVVGIFAEEATIPAGAKPLTVELKPDDPDTEDVDESKATIKDLPRLKNTVYTARETKINNEAIDYKDNGIATTNLGESKIVTSNTAEYKGDGKKFESLRDSKGVKVVRGAIADNRLWAIALNGNYYVTEVNDTDGSGTWVEYTEADKDDLIYDRAQKLLGIIDSQGRFAAVRDEELDNDKIEDLDQSIGTPTETKVFDIIPSVTATNSTSSIEKYVNDDVHSDLGEFDKAFKYDILVYVPAGSTELTITDPLKTRVLEFAKKKDSLDAAKQTSAEKAETADDTIAAVVAKDKNDHTANSTVAGKDSDNEGADIASKISSKSIDDNTLTIKFEGKADTEHEGNKLPLDFAGKWVQVTFWAKYKDEIIKAADAGEFDKIRENGAVISEKYPGVTENAPAEEFSHEGTANKASAAIGINNDANFELNSNEVTVKPDTEKLWVQKVLDNNGTVMTKWPEGLKIKFNVYKNINNNKEVVQEIVIDSLNKVSSKELPKLIGVKYTADEVAVPAGITKVGEASGAGTETDPITVTNRIEGPAIEKYINKDVDAHLVEFDRAFTYDILAYVTYDAEKLVISDKLVDALEFSATGEGKGIASSDPEKVVARVAVKDDNNHMAASKASDDIKPTVSDADAGTNKPRELKKSEYKAAIDEETKTLTITLGGDDEETKIKDEDGLRGKWIQVTFHAKYTEEAIKKAEVAYSKGISDNGSVISEIGPHDGTCNEAKYNILVNNTDKYETVSNRVTHDAKEEKVWVQKKWLDKEGKGLSRWPKGMKVKVNVYKNSEGGEAEILETLEVDSLKPVSSQKYPKLIGVSYSVDEPEVPGRYTKLDNITGDGSKEKPFVITNAARKYTSAEITKKWVGATMDEIPSAEDFKTYLVLKDSKGRDVSEEYADNLTVTARGSTYKAKWNGLPDGEYTVEEKEIPGFASEVDGNIIINKKKPSEEKPEIEKYVNQAVHKEITLDEVFTYDIIAYVTKDADSVTITDKLHDMLTFAGDSSDVSVVDLGEADNHLVTNNTDGVRVNENASVAQEGKPVDGAEVELNGQTLKVFITNKLKKTTAKGEDVYTAVEIESVNPNKNGYYELIGEGYVLTEDTVPAADKTYYVMEESKEPDKEPSYKPVTIEIIDPSEQGYYEHDGYEYVLTKDKVPDADTTYYVKEGQPEEADGYEYDGENQPVTALRGHWVRVTFNARINGRTLDEVKKAYRDISASDVDDSRDPDNVGNAPVVSAENHTGLPNDASYTIGVANEAGIQGDVHKDRSNVVTVRPKESEKPDKPDKPKEFDIKISKTDLQGEELPGAKITVTGPDGFKETWTSTDKPHVLKLKPGEYEMKEVVSPEGFNSVTTTIKFRVDEDGKVTLLTGTVDNGGEIELLDVDHIVLRDAPKPTVNKTVNSGDEYAYKGNDESFTYTINVDMTYVPDESLVIVDEIPDVLELVNEDKIAISVNGKKISSADRDSMLSIDGNTLEVEPSLEQMKAWGAFKMKIEFDCRIREDADLEPYKDSGIVNVAKAKVDGALIDMPGDEDKATVLGVYDEGGGDEEGDDKGRKASVRSADTGDDASIYIWMTVLMISLGAVLYAVIRRRRMN